MTQWFAADDRVAAQLAGKIEQGDTANACPDDMLDAALRSDRDAVAVLRGRRTGESVIVTIHKQALPPPDVVDLPGSTDVAESPKMSRTSGFLGLTDELIYEEEEVPTPKKKWWKKVF